MVRRLTYQPITKKASTRLDHDFEDGLSFEIPIDINESEAPSPEAPSSDAPPVETTSPEAHCFNVANKSWNILMPHRQNDLKITVTDTSEISRSSVPESLDVFAKEFKEFMHASNPGSPGNVAPAPPPYVWHNGHRYSLVGNENVRRSTRTVVQKLDSNFPIIGDPDQSSRFELSIITERVKDAEVDLSHSRCEVYYDNVSSQEGWFAFLRSCDFLTTSPVVEQTYRSR
jgi:hypothetical protein